VNAPDATCRLLTPRAGTGGAVSGAIAILHIESETAEAMSRALNRLGFGEIAVGEVALRDLLGIDRGLVCRWSGTGAQLMPHGGAMIVRQLEHAIGKRGVRCDSEAVSGSLDSRFPEARDPIEACALDAISRARSEIAIDLILEHADRARAGVPIDPSLGAMDALIEPPIVACVGQANVGKSSLLNALACRDVSVVADVPGTTRDHVGVSLECAGLTIRWVDTPGVRPGADEIESRAHEIAQGVVERSALIVSCADAEHGFVESHEANCPVLSVGTKCDLGRVEGASRQTSAREAQGLDELARAIREAIIPAHMLDSAGLWAFSDGLGGVIAG